MHTVFESDRSLVQVLLASIQQIAILMTMCILLSLIPFVRKVFRALRDRFIPSAHSPKAHDGSGKQNAALQTALQEFQKVQAFFCLALQVAFVLALNNSTWLDGPTVNQLAFTLFTIMEVSVSRVSTVTIGLLILRKSKGRLVWFTLAVSLVCIVMSSAIWYTSMHIRISQLRQSGFNPSECGGINPIQHCLSSDIGKLSEYVPKNFNVYYQWTSAVPLFVTFALTIEIVFPITTWHLPECLPKALKLTILSTALFLAEAWLLWGNVSLLVALCWMWVDKDIEDMTWTLGQIIGAGIFIPVFLEWLYLAICKCSPTTLFPEIDTLT